MLLRRAVRFHWALIALLVATVACSQTSSGASAGSSAGASAGTQPTASAGARPTATGSAAAASLVQGVGGLVFTPPRLSIKKGAKILVSDESFFQHTFTIPGTPIDVINDPGQFQTVTIDLPAGTYLFVCTIHQSQGMKGTLIVTA